MNPFDILIVDEASQMKPAELSLGMSIIGEEKDSFYFTACCSFQHALPVIIDLDSEIQIT